MASHNIQHVKQSIINTPTKVKATRTTTLVCKKNHKLLKEYGILKGQIIQVVSNLLVKYYDRDLKLTRYVKLSKKLMKKFKE